MARGVKNKESDFAEMQYTAYWHRYWWL